jgi:uncharacterized Zn finger protein
MSAEEGSDDTIRASPQARARSVHAAEVFCDTCGEPTEHRILRVDPASASGALQGVARCRVCRTTHPFRVRPAPAVDVAVVRSDGPRSAPMRVRIPRSAVLRIGDELPGAAERLRIVRLDRPNGSAARSAGPAEIATAWVSPWFAGRIPVSIVEGRRTRSLPVEFDPAGSLGVGRPVEVEGRPYVVSALRARGHTWRHEGDAFATAEVTRLYVRRAEMPPAGNRAWSRDLGSSRDWDSSTSTSARRRSSPGVTTARTRPRARSADGGATDQSDSPR